MAHAHAHAHGDPGGRPGRRASRSLAVVLVLTLAFAVAEVVGGLLAGSLALLADAAHMASDASSLALALGAIWLARRDPTPRMSFGLRRAEILAALVNGVALVAVAIWIFIEASARLGDPPEVDAGTTLAIGVAGLGVNVAGAAVLWRDRGAGLNVRAAFLHVLGDLLGSAGVVAAALVILAGGPEAADPAFSVLIGVLILVSARRVLAESVTVLLEGAPPGIDPEAVGRRMAGAPGVREVHDLHVWTITSGFPALSAHVLVGRADDCHAVRRDLALMLERDFGIDHTTLQVEHEPAPGRHGIAGVDLTH